MTDPIPLRQVTNYLGIEWMQRHLGDEYRIHILNFEVFVPAFEPGEVVLLTNIGYWQTLGRALARPTLFWSNAFQSRYVNCNGVALGLGRLLQERSASHSAYAGLTTQPTQC